MNIFKQICVVFFFFILPQCIAYFEKCDNNYVLGPSEQKYINSPNYPVSQYEPGSSCRYTIKAPSGYQIVMQCNINLPTVNSACQSDFFYISSDNDNYEYFCGYGYIARTSLFNTATLAYISVGTSTSGYFSCLVYSSVQQCDCGWNYVKRARIVGGTEAAVNEFVSMAGFYLKINAEPFCGGAIISYRYILTAAHCFINQDTSDPNEIGVFVGDHDYKTGSDTKYSQIFDIQSIIKHENFNSQTNQNDVALVKTTEDITWSRGVGPACLPFRIFGNTFEGNAIQIAGWGSSFFGGPKSTILRKTTLNVLSRATCPLNQICTYFPGHDACQYDSGGPLFWTGSDGKIYTIGIISAGIQCATPNAGINTRVTSYLNWIVGNTPDVGYCVP